MDYVEYADDIVEYVDDFDYVESTSGLDFSSLMALFATYSIIILIVSIVMIVEMAIIFKKCGKKWWAVLVPVYNMWVMLEIADLPGWLVFVPVANMVGLLISYFKIPKKLGKSAAFGVGCLFLPIIFFGILAFSKEKNINAVEASTSNVSNPTANLNNETAIPAATSNEVPTVDVNVSNESPAVDVPEVMPDLMAAPSLDENVSGNINVVSEERQYMNESPALNTDENISDSDMPKMAEPNLAQDTSKSMVDEVNAFDMPAPAANNQTINVPGERSVSDQALTDALVDNASNNEVLGNEQIPDVLNQSPSVDTPVIENAPIDNSLNEPAANDLFSTQSINAAINNDITETKKCPVCGHDNPYINKVCDSCGNNLE